MSEPSVEALAHEIEQLADQVARGANLDRERARSAVTRLLAALESGNVRAAVPGTNRGRWSSVPWVKEGILLGFRSGELVPFAAAGPLTFCDKDLYPPRDAGSMTGVRVVPGGTAVRRGAFVAPEVVLMPPCYVNVGAHVGRGTMIDSHALVGSCAQIGAGVHLSAGVQIGGVLEPPGALPVIVEDGAFVGALSAVLEGVQVGAGAVIGAGVILTRSTPLFDVPRRCRVEPDADGVLRIAERAVVIAGGRPLNDPWAREQGLTGAAALIVKDRDSGTDARAALESALR